VTSAVYFLSTAGSGKAVEEKQVTVEELAKCIADANGNKGKIKQCQRDFTDGGGTEGPQEGGKVFTDTKGGKVFVTDDGKVYGGKVF
jgi:hypothetical protein